MRLTRQLLALTLFCSGGLCLLGALESDAAAVSCNPTVYSPSTCTPAHEEAAGNASSSGGCRINANGQCVDAPSSGCTSTMGFGTALAGACATQPAGSTPYQCTENYGVTVVRLHRWRSLCVHQDGSCTCVAEAVPGDSSDVQVCNCKDEEV